MATHATFVREAGFALAVALGTIILLGLACEAHAAPATCSCDAYFEVVVETRGRDFKTEIPVNHFTALKDMSAFQTENACRSAARDQALACMDAIYANRGQPRARPSQCSPRSGIRGDVPYDIIRRAERAVCVDAQTPPKSMLDWLDNGFIKSYRRRTHGGDGCAPISQSDMPVFVDHRKVECPQRLGGIDKTRIAGIDRPGSDLPGSGVTVGNGTVDACEAACNQHIRCKAWTWAPPANGAQSKCWIKGRVPKPVPASGMISGTRQPVGQ